MQHRRMRGFLQELLEKNLTGPKHLNGIETCLSVNGGHGVD